MSLQREKGTEMNLLREVGGKKKTRVTIKGSTRKREGGHDIQFFVRGRLKYSTLLNLSAAVRNQRR